MPSKKCKNPSCTETNPEFYAHRNLCKKCYLEHNKETRKKPQSPSVDALEKDIAELRSIVNILIKKLDEVTIK
jgi:hypothetical protein